MKNPSAIGAVLALFVSLSFAQTGTTSVRGTVLDKSGAAVAAAKVTVTNEQALQRETQTDNPGEYRLLALPPGTYTLTVEKAGFRTFQQSKLELPVNVAV